MTTDEILNKKFLSVSEVCAILGICRKTFMKRFDYYSNQFPIEVHGNRYSVPTLPFKYYLETGKSFFIK